MSLRNVFEEFNCEKSVDTQTNHWMENYINYVSISPCKDTGTHRHSYEVTDTHTHLIPSLNTSNVHVCGHDSVNIIGFMCICLYT